MYFPRSQLWHVQVPQRKAFFSPILTLIISWQESFSGVLCLFFHGDSRKRRRSRHTWRFPEENTHDVASLFIVLCLFSWCCIFFSFYGWLFSASSMEISCLCSMKREEVIKDIVYCKDVRCLFWRSRWCKRWCNRWRRRCVEWWRLRRIKILN